MRARASEFPNDNAALHRGAVWVTHEPCAQWEAERSATPAPSLAASASVAVAQAPAVVQAVAAPAPSPDLPTLLDDDPPDDIEVVEELDPIELDLSQVDDDPFATFIRTLVEVATDAGCEKAAAILPALLDGGRVVPGVLPQAVSDALLGSGVLARTDGGLVGGESFRKTAAAWRAILRGDSEDFSSCGTRMLDEWAADLVACLVAAPAKTERLRRELRTRGIAAFGLVLAA